MTSSPALFPAVTVTVVRDRKIRTALRTNQIAGFVTVTEVLKMLPEAAGRGQLTSFLQVGLFTQLCH